MLQRAPLAADVCLQLLPVGWSAAPAGTCDMFGWLAMLLQLIACAGNTVTTFNGLMHARVCSSAWAQGRSWLRQPCPVDAVPGRCNVNALPTLVTVPTCWSPWSTSQPCRLSGLPPSCLSPALKGTPGAGATNEAGLLRRLPLRRILVLLRPLPSGPGWSAAAAAWTGFDKRLAAL